MALKPPLVHIVDSCGYCGKKGHGKSAPPKIRQKECLGYGHTCKNCERDNHYESVCRSSTSKPKVKQNEESESAVFDSLCAAAVSPLGKRTIQLDHHLYSQMYNTWIKRPSQPQPFINIVVKVVEDDNKQLGFQNSLVSQQRSAVISAMADTDCQSCLAGIKVLYKIGLTKRDLIPVNMQMHAANNKGIVILEAVIIRLSGKGQDKNELETRLIVYITDSFFQETKTVIISEIEEGVRIFDKSKPTDWSKSGLGFWLFQKHCNCQKILPFWCKEGWKITLVGSRFTHDAESRYAPVEGEALAVVDSLDKARYFVLGCEELIIAVDHKPLLKFFGDRSLDQISNTRLRNLKEKTLRYKFKMMHVAGAKHRAADTVSRNPTGNNSEELKLIDDIALITEDSNQFDYFSFQTIQNNFLSSITKDDCCDVCLDEELQLAAASSINTFTINHLEHGTCCYQQ
ncbi:Hypothetical predicted protein [Mytilus galloprovincialis]|uniref:Reverse transcriptase RNase H-like domain-containing protein n=1 Tax=Mytilus galloprovincialis TaxID=29158 RepID=A0A8B6CBD8_MYTGA|nr:Hypothetical predicted protein [Mytilus galloprovincialis]